MCRDLFVVLIIFFLLGFARTQCDSTCATCSAYCNNCCLTCYGPLFYDGTAHTCRPNPALNQVSQLNQSWVSPQGFITSIVDSGGNPFYDSMSVGWVAATGLTASTGDHLLLNMANIVPHYEVTVRVSSGLSSEPGCMKTSIQLFWSNEVTNPSAHTFSTTLTILSSFQTLSHTIMHTASAEQFKFLNLGDLSCTFLTIYDFAFIFSLCPLGCLTCDAPNSCTDCGVDLSGKPLYFDSALMGCTSVCALNYYQDSVSQIYQCDKCDFSCLSCASPLPNNNCIACNSAAGYVLAYGSSTMCTPNCSLGQFISGSPQACTLCDPNCRSCNALATNCTSCGLDTILQQQQYLTATRTCSLTCLSSYYIFAANSIYECDKCDPACLVCSAPMSPSACKTCNNDAGFVLAFGSTTTCTSGCTPAQFISGTPLACTPCDLNCLSCDAVANNCTSCGLDTNGKQMYLLSMGTYYQCSVLCPFSYYVYTVGNKYECDKCDPACTHCSAPADSSSCSSCNNDAGYYFSLGSTSNCILGCPGGQFPTGLPLTCTACNSNCQTCDLISTNCTSCGFSSLGGQLFLTPTSTCAFVCPATTFKNQSSFVCEKCDVACLDCWATSASSCSRCSNVTVGAVLTIYYLHSGGTLCSTSCPSGQYIDLNFPNLCQICNARCLQCSIVSTNCTGSVCASGYYYYEGNCYSVCPYGTYSNTTNSTDQQCYKCSYFTLEGRCLQQCPSGYIGVVGNVSFCEACANDNCAGTSTSSSFSVRTLVTNNGQSYQHRVSLPNGLSSNTTAASLQDGLVVELADGSRRLLLTTTTLTVQGLVISTDNLFIYILTNYYPASIYSSSVSITFRAGALVTASGSYYNQLSSSVSLNNPAFIQSYYQAFGKKDSLQAQGIVFSILALLFWVVAAVVLGASKLEHECMGLVQLVQVIGLSRVRNLPFDFNFFTILSGFSHYQLRFLPNRWTELFYNYTETSLDSAAFVYGFQNFILNYGTVFYFFVPLQIILLVILLIFYCRKNEDRFVRVKRLIEQVANLWSTIFIYGSMLCLLSVENNQISSENSKYAITILISFMVLIGYGVYFSLSVRQNLQDELYKVGSIGRIAGLLMLANGQRGGILLINFLEVFFYAVDYSLYRSQKYNIILYSLQRIGILFILNGSLLELGQRPLLILFGVTFSLLILLRAYYFINVAMGQFKEQNQLKEKPLKNQSIDLSKNELQSVQQPKQPAFASTFKPAPIHPSNNVISNNTVVESSSIVFEEKAQHLTPKVNTDSRNEMRDVVQELAIDNTSSEPPQSRWAVKRRRFRIEPVMIKESRGTTRRDQEEVEERQEEREEPVETLQIDNLSEDKRSDSYNFEEGLDEVWT